jgi:hypothetical protein
MRRHQPLPAEIVQRIHDVAHQRARRAISRVTAAMDSRTDTQRRTLTLDVLKGQTAIRDGLDSVVVALRKNVPAGVERQHLIATLEHWWTVEFNGHYRRSIESLRDRPAATPTTPRRPGRPRAVDDAPVIQILADLVAHGWDKLTAAKAVVNELRAISEPREIEIQERTSAGNWSAPTVFRSSRRPGALSADTGHARRLVVALNRHLNKTIPKPRRR